MADTSLALPNQFSDSSFAWGASAGLVSHMASVFCGTPPPRFCLSLFSRMETMIFSNVSGSTGGTCRFVVQDSTGKKLRFVPPLLVEQGNHGLVLRVMYIKTDGKFTGIFFVRHGSHRSPC